MTTVEEITEILNSIQSCHPSREDDIKAKLCIEALARRIDDITKAINRMENKMYEANRLTAADIIG